MRLYPKVSAIFLIWFAALFFIAFSAFNLLPHSGRFDQDFLKSLSNWDGGHYLGIAEFGYSERFQYAFFPMYPLLIKYLALITGNFLLSALLISIVCSYLALQILYRLISVDFGGKLAEKAVLFLLIFPASFYFLTVYSEGLFFFLVSSAFYFLRKQKLFWAVVFAAAASATRVAGVAVVLALLVETYLSGGIGKKNWFVLLSPLGLILYCLFLNTQTGDPFYFITAEKYWLRFPSQPLAGFWETIKNLATPGFISSNFSSFLDLIFAVFGVGFIIRSFRFLPLSYSVYGLVSLSLPLLTPSLSSIPRFLLVIFPIFLLLSLVKNKYLIMFYQIVSLMFLGLFVALFINGYWVS